MEERCMVGRKGSKREEGSGLEKEVVRGMKCGTMLERKKERRERVTQDKRKRMLELRKGRKGKKL